MTTPNSSLSSGRSGPSEVLQAMSHHSTAVSLTLQKSPYVLAAILVTALALGCIYPCMGARSQQPLVVAINPWPGYEFATLARELGFFHQEGIEVRIVELSSLGDSRRAFERGQADGFFATNVEMLYTKDKLQRTPRITLVADYSNGANVLIAPKSIESISSLQGKRVGVELGALNAIILARALTSRGLTWEDVQAINMPAIDMENALKSGKIDAAVSYPPMSFEILSDPNMHVLFSSSSIPGEIVDVLIFDDSTIRQRPKDIEAFHRAYHRAQQFSIESPDRAMEIMASRERLSPEKFKECLTDGIQIVYRQDQKTFLSPTGSLSKSLEVLREDLINMQQIRGDWRVDDLIYPGRN